MVVGAFWLAEFKAEALFFRLKAVLNSIGAADYMLRGTRFVIVLITSGEEVLALLSLGPAPTVLNCLLPYEYCNVLSFVIIFIVLCFLYGFRAKFTSIVVSVY